MTSGGIIEHKYQTMVKLSCDEVSLCLSPQISTFLEAFHLNVVLVRIHCCSLQSFEEEMRQCRRSVGKIEYLSPACKASDSTPYCT